MNGFVGVRLPTPVVLALKEKCKNEDNNVSNFLRTLISNAIEDGYSND